MTAKIEIFPLRHRALRRFDRGQAAAEERAARFRQGLPVTVVNNGIRVRECPDGKLETLSGNRPPVD